MILVTKTSDQTRQRVCVCVCEFIKLHITAQSGSVILVIPPRGGSMCMCSLVVGGAALEPSFVLFCCCYNMYKIG